MKWCVCPRLSFLIVLSWTKSTCQHEWCEPVYITLIIPSIGGFPALGTKWPRVRGNSEECFLIEQLFVCLLNYTLKRGIIMLPRENKTIVACCNWCPWVLHLPWVQNTMDPITAGNNCKWSDAVFIMHFPTTLSHVTLKLFKEFSQDVFQCCIMIFCRSTSAMWCLDPSWMRYWLVEYEAAAGKVFIVSLLENSSVVLVELVRSKIQSFL